MKLIEIILRQICFGWLSCLALWLYLVKKWNSLGWYQYWFMVFNAKDNVALMCKFTGAKTHLEGEIWLSKPGTVIKTWHFFLSCFFSFWKRNRKWIEKRKRFVLLSFPYTFLFDFDFSASPSDLGSGWILITGINELTSRISTFKGL